MATVYRCDRCKNETTDGNSFYTIAVPLDYDKTSKTYYDLCQSCLLELRAWMTKK